MKNKTPKQNEREPSNVKGNAQSPFLKEGYTWHQHDQITLLTVLGTCCVILNQESWAWKTPIVMENEHWRRLKYLQTASFFYPSCFRGKD